MTRDGGKGEVNMGARVYVCYLIVAGLISLMLGTIASPVMAANLCHSQKPPRWTFKANP